MEFDTRVRGLAPQSARAPLRFAGPHVRLLSLGSELVYEKCATMSSVQSFDLLHVLTLCLNVHHQAQSDVH
jgi:hypothetical protein